MRIGTDSFILIGSKLYFLGRKNEQICVGLSSFGMQAASG